MRVGRRRTRATWGAPGRVRPAHALLPAAAALAAVAAVLALPGTPRVAPASALAPAPAPDGRALALLAAALPAWGGVAGAGSAWQRVAELVAGGGAVAPPTPPPVPPYPPSAAHPPNARPPDPAPPPPDVYGTRPLVAIYHTDSTEAYLPAMRAAGLPATAPFSRDQAVGVVQVGAVLAQALWRLGVAAVHSRAVNDPDGVIGAYENSQRTARALLAAYPSVRILLDLHRGGAGEAQAPPPPSGTGSEAPAGVVLVVGTDDRLPQPHWRQNLAFARVLAAAAARLYPGWPVAVVVSPNQYNQELSPGALLVEVGGPHTALASADAAARRLARVLAAVVEGGLYPGAGGG
jgi:stage II sporulation protein P